MVWDRRAKGFAVLACAAIVALAVEGFLLFARSTAATAPLPAALPAPPSPSPSPTHHVPQQLRSPFTGMPVRSKKLRRTYGIRYRQ